MASIFPAVTVTIIKPLEAGAKQVQAMPVGLVGPMFKRLTEIKENGYAIRSSTVDGVSMNLTSPTDSQYIDFASVGVQLEVAGTDDVITLANVDEELISDKQLVQSNITIDSVDTGFYVDVGATGDESIFYPSTGKSTTYSAVPGDFLYLKTANVEINDLIKKTVPTQLSPNNFPTPTSFVTDTFTWNGSSSDSYFEAITEGKYLVLVDKNNSDNIRQYKIDSIVNSTNNSIVIDITGDITLGNIETSGSVASITPVTQWNYFVYDMPIGSLVTYRTTDLDAADYVNDGTTYKVYDRNFTVDSQGKADGTFGRFVTTGTANEQIFMPTKRATSDYYAANIGDYLRATNIDTDVEVDFRIVKKTSDLLRTFTTNKNFTVHACSEGEGDIDTSSPPSTIDGVTLVNDVTRVLLTEQTAPADNGIYIMESDSLVRSLDADAISDTEIHTGMVVSVLGGTTNANLAFKLTSTNIVYGSTALTFVPVTGHAYDLPITIESTEYEDNKVFLIAKNKTNTELTRIYKVTDISDPVITVTNTDFSSNGSGANNAYILEDFNDWSWSLYRIPPGSLLLSSLSTDFQTVTGSATGTSSITSWIFTIVNKADFHMTGKTELTINNHIADSDGDEIGLANVIVTYNVLETEYSTQMWDIVTQSDRFLVCGEAANYNPLGLAAGMVEINTRAAYKVIPCDIGYSERDPDNPKSYAGSYKVGEANPNFHDVTVLDWIGSYEVFDLVRDTQIPYYITPLSQDASVTGLSVTTVESLSQPDKMKEMITFITSELATFQSVQSSIVPLLGDFVISLENKLQYTPTTIYDSGEDANVAIDFLTLGIRKGDYVVGKVPDTLGVEEVSFKINNIYPDFLDLGSTTYTTPAEVLALFDTNYNIEIKRYFNTKALQAEALAKKSAAYGSFRVKFLWGDQCDIEIEGVKFTALPSYYAAAAYAAMANNKGVVVPKTNWPINGLTKIYNTTPKFGVADLETMGEGFMDILAQDFDSGPVFSKRQFMTDGSELSAVEVVDELAKYIRILFRPYLGKYNIDRPLFDVLGMVLSTIDTTYVPNKLNKLTIVKPFTVTGPNSDRLSLTLKPETKRPFNGLDVEIQIV